MLEIRGEKVILREFSRDHLDDVRYVDWLRDPEVTKTIYRMEYLLPLEAEKIRDYARTLMESKTDGFFAIHTLEDEFIGTLRIGHVDWRAGVADIGILIGDKDYWGKGMAKDAVGAACEYAFSFLSLRKLTGGTAADNLAMCRCFERLGFQKEATLRRQLLTGGRYQDHVLYGLFKDELAEQQEGSWA